MMINVKVVGDLTFEVRLDEKMRKELLLRTGRGPVEELLQDILSEALLGPSYPEDYDGDLDDDVPF